MPRSCPPSSNQHSRRSRPSWVTTRRRSTGFWRTPWSPSPPRCQRDQIPTSFKEGTVSVLDTIPVIDVDTHIIEPYDLWTSRVSTKKWGDRVPHVRWDDRINEELWFAGDQIIGSGAAAAAAGWKEAPPKHAPKLELVDPGTWRAEDRLGLMDEYGIHAQVLYP